MTRVELVPRIPGGRRPRGVIDGPLTAAGGSVRVRWDDGLVTGVRSQFLRVHRPIQRDPIIRIRRVDLNGWLTRVVGGRSQSWQWFCTRCAIKGRTPTWDSCLRYGLSHAQLYHRGLTYPPRLGADLRRRNVR